ncbi:MAG: nucleotide exchange factor GrpE [Eubacteriales bacterium]|nr:nucleotide exchange factor GrpE [Eubacteriales bacterium]
MSEEQKKDQTPETSQEETAEAKKPDPASEAETEVKEPSDAKAEDTAEAKESKESEKSGDDGNEKYVRLMAEFQNYKKRVTKEKNDIREYATEKLITELLPVLDNFERALAASAEDDPAGYAKGMELIFTQMKTELEKSGLAELEAEGQDFDPAKHNAVMTEESEELDSGKVSKVLQKGYTLNDKVIRPSMVAVTK